MAVNSGITIKIDEALLAEIERLRTGAYVERDRLVAAISKVFPSHLCRHPDGDTEWEEDWRWIVCVHLPTGQATWHIHDSERCWFDHLPVEPNHWDGHTTEEKYRRLENLRRGRAITRLLKIENCDECLHCGFDDKCWFVWPHREFDPKDGIPDWCPLPKEASGEG